MTLLEAAAAGLPVFVRDIPSLRALGTAPLWRTVPDLLTMLDDFPNGPAFQAARRAAAELSSRHTLDSLRAGIFSAYRAAAPEAFGVVDLIEGTPVGGARTIAASSNKTPTAL
jgi:hypothetical protein